MGCEAGTAEMSLGAESQALIINTHFHVCDLRLVLPFCGLNKDPFLTFSVQLAECQLAGQGPLSSPA